MKIDRLLEAEKKESGPSGFEKIRSQGVQTFSKKRFRVNITLNDQGLSKLKSANPEAEDVTAEDVRETLTVNDVKDEKEAIVQTFQQFKSSDFLKYTTARGIEKTISLSAKDVVVNAVDVSETAPGQIRQRLYGKSDLSDAATIKKIAAADAITLKNIRQIANTGDKRTKIFTGILDEFINNPGTKNFPVTVLNDTTQIVKTYGFDNTADIINDFAEVLAPVGLLTDNLNGNGQRLIADFLGANSMQELANGATMHFQPGRNFPLVDSYVEYNGRVVSISSKSNGGAAASFAGFSNSIREIEENPTAKKMFDELLSNPRFAQAYEVLKAIISTDTEDEELIEAKTSTAKIEKSGGNVKMTTGMLSMESYIDRAYTLINLLKRTAIGRTTLQNIELTSDDVKLMKSFIKDKNVSTLGAWKDNDKLTADFQQMFDKFSPGFKHLFVYYRSPENAMGRAFQQGNKLTTVKTKNSIWTAFKNGCAFHINNALNKDQAYSDLATWIFNHGAIIQVNFVTSQGYNWSTKHKNYDFRGNGYLTQANKNAQPLVFYNMIATWPSTGVDAVTFEWGAGEDTVRNRMNADGHDLAFPTKDSELSIAINQEDPVASAMIARLDKNDPEYNEKVTNIYLDVADKRRTREADIAKSPDKLAQMGITKSNQLKSAIGRGVSGSDPANFFISRVEAYRIAASGLTDGEISKKYGADVKVGSSPDKLSDLLTKVKEARLEILKLVLYRNTDKTQREKYNNLVSNDLIGTDNPNKVVHFNEADDYSNIYPKTASQRQAYTSLLDPNAADRVDTIIIAAIRNFERIKAQQPNRFAQLLKDSGLSTTGGSIDRETMSKLDARQKLNSLLSNTSLKIAFNKIPREEHPHVYTELIDMISIGATDDEIKSEIINWKQNELASGGADTPIEKAAKVKQPKQPKQQKQQPAVAKPVQQTQPMSIAGGSAIQKIKRFIALTGIIKKESSPLKTGNKVFGFAKTIINDSGNFPDNFEQALAELARDESVRALVNSVTARIKNHPSDVNAIFENLLDNDDMVVKVFAALYWAYMARQYRLAYPREQYAAQAVDNVKRFCTELNITGAEKERQGHQRRTIDKLEFSESSSDILKGILG